MMENEEYIDWFERYKNGELSPTELKELEARLVYDAEFNEAFQAYQAIEKGIKTFFRNQLKSKLAIVDAKMDEEPQRPKVIQLAVWTSSVAAAIIIGVFIFQHFVTTPYKQLAQQFWVHEAGLPVKMSAKGKYDDAMNAFKLEDWNKSEQLLKIIHTDTATYFLGVVAYRQNEFKKATHYFTEVPQNSHYYHEAQFRLALSYLSEDNVEMAINTLTTSIKKDSSFKKESEMILDVINKHN